MCLHKVRQTINTGDHSTTGFMQSVSNSSKKSFVLSFVACANTEKRARLTKHHVATTTDNPRGGTGNRVATSR